MKDLIVVWLESGVLLIFEVSEVVLYGVDDLLLVMFVVDGVLCELFCDVIVGCDGFYGVLWLAVGLLTVCEREYLFGWLGIFVEVLLLCDELIYVHFLCGFALYSMRLLELFWFYV